MQISDHADMKSTKKAYSDKKFQKEPSRGQISFGFQVQSTFP